MSGSTRGASLSRVPGVETLAQRARRLVELAQGRKRALILTHDNPDPDGISSALALAQIFEEKAALPSTLAYGGLVGRAENRAMLRILRLPFVPMHRIDLSAHDLVCMVDTQPEAENHSLPVEVFPDVLIDHQDRKSVV